MNIKDKYKIIKISKKIRNFWEKESTDYHLQSYCKIVSIDLLKALQKININCDLIEGTCHGIYHYWLQYKEYIIDLTATQFNKDICIHSKIIYPEIFIKPISKCKQYCKESYA